MSSKTIIFDLDDTLIRTGHLFVERRQQIFELLNLVHGAGSFGRETFFSLFDYIEGKNIKEKGFQKDRFPLSAGETYEIYQIAHGRPVDSSAKSQVLELAWSVFEGVCEIKAHAHDVVASLGGAGHRLVLCTKGDQEVQLKRIQQTGFSDHFGENIFIVPDKTIPVYEDLKSKYGKNDVWMVGDSIKSDINPAISVGFNAIFIPSPDTWQYYEYVKPVSPAFYTAKNLLEAQQILMKE